MPALPTRAESGAIVANPKNKIIAETIIKYTSFIMINPLKIKSAILANLRLKFYLKTRILRSCDKSASDLDADFVLAFDSFSQIPHWHKDTKSK